MGRGAGGAGRLPRGALGGGGRGAPEEEEVVGARICPVSPAPGSVAKRLRPLAGTSFIHPFIRSLSRSVLLCEALCELQYVKS